MSEGRSANLSPVRVDVHDFVAVVTIDRPPVNAFDAEMGRQLIAAFDAFTDRDDVRAVILTGAGNVFSAGADIKARATKEFNPGERWEHNRLWRECPLAIMECKKPVIAAVNGPALGGGLCLIACCDIIVASTRAALGLSEIDVGLLGGARHAMRLFGHSLLRRMVFSGYRVSGAEMYRLGICEACVEEDALPGTALTIARDVAAKSPVAIKLAKLSVNTIEDMSLRDGYRFEQEMTADLARYEDSKEAMRAFLEKRPGQFTGR